MSKNHTKQEENVPSEESIISSPYSLKMMETETAETEHIADTTTVNTEIKETTSSTEVFNQSGAQKADRLQSTEETTTTIWVQNLKLSCRCRTNNNNNIQATTEKSFSGLRMRGDIPADEGTENKARGYNTKNQKPKENIKMIPNWIHLHSQSLHKQTTNKLQKKLPKVSEAAEDQISATILVWFQEWFNILGTLNCFLAESWMKTWIPLPYLSTK